MPDKTKNQKPGIVNKNLFPVHVLPSFFKDIVKGLNETLNYPTDYTSTAILVAIATIIGTTVKVKVKDKWYEFGALYACVIGNAGANKSHPLATIFNPLKKLDKESHDAYVSKYKDYSAYLKLSPKQKEAAIPVSEPVLIKLILSDFTPEILSQRLSDNLHGCAVLSDELVSFLDDMSNYSKSNNSSKYLSFYSNQATTIDRVGKPIPLLIDIPYLSIIGGLQPRLLGKAFQQEKLNSGFFHRFLFAFPQGVHKEAINDNVLDSKILEQYSDFITSYIKSCRAEKAKTRVLNWTKEAKNYFYEWQSKNCELVNANSDNIIGELISKFDIHFIRLSLILQMMADPSSTEIGLKAVKGASALCKYYMNCAFKVLAKIQNPKDLLNSLAENKKRFYKQLKNKFTTAEAIEFGKNFDFQERRLKDFLKDPYFFKKIKHGKYEKKIKSQPSN